MRIVITSNYEIGNETGSAKVAEVMSSKLSKNNEVFFICLGKYFEEIKKSNSLTIVTIPSVVIKNIYFPIITPFLMYQVFKKIDSFSPDVVHAQNSVLVSSMARMWSNINSVPFVVTFHHIPTEAVEHIIPSLSKTKFANLVQDIYEEITLKNFLQNTNLVVAQNHRIAKSIRSIYKNVKIEIINNGVEIKHLNKIKPNINYKRVNFTFLGSYNIRKNQKLLVKVFKHLPSNYHLKIYGKISTGKEYYDQLQVYIMENKIKNVELNDFENDLIKIFKKTDYFVSASKKEAQCLSIIQAMAAGKPVIGLSNETIDDLVNKDNGLALRKNTSPNVFAQNILKFVKNINYTILSNRNKKDSIEFDIDNVVLKTQQTYKRLCQSYSKNC
ncbi:MAG: glycosyl transferase group 1 [uncultured bacterium]|nr:MAG: glycosyl transferase group 1 [uncultured bacterium]